MLVLCNTICVLLAATFALFTLTIIHFKRQQTKTRTSTGGSSGAADCIGLNSPTTPTMLADGVSPATLTATEPRFASVWADYYSARVFTVGWSLDLGWGGVTLCVLASVLWILLSKIMRYNPLTTTTHLFA